MTARSCGGAWDFSLSLGEPALTIEKQANFVPVGALDKRRASKRELLRGLVRQAPFVAKNFGLYFRNGWRRQVLHTKLVAPYAVTFYVTHRCNLDCSYCTQKEPDVFSDELDTAGTLQVLKRIRRESDSIVITGGEPTLRADIEQIVTAARFGYKFRSVLLITNGTLLDRKLGILNGVTGLVVSLDALQAHPTNPLSKPAAVTKVLENLELAKGRLGSPPKITISTVIEEWNVTEVERLLDWCGEQGFVFAAQSAQMEKMPNLALLKSAKYQALVDKIIERRREGKQAINGTPKTIETLLRFRDFQCYPTMFPRVYPNGDVFYPCEPLRKIAGNLLRDGSLVKIFAAGKKKYGDIPPCQGICYLFGNVLSHYYVNDFWGLAGDFIR
ncbi:MAG TPA: radical SAM protein [Candidatus Eisenbacteria bacterium]|jgi:MoaA/NifB/PqqE/SkfB family radical SAM enzyme|nr:radical SAM protein [Candidatus Eisenbacteria bacterium]